ALFCSIPLSLTSLTLFRLTPPPPPISTLFPYTTLFRSQFSHPIKKLYSHTHKTVSLLINRNKKALTTELLNNKVLMQLLIKTTQDRKSTRLNSSHVKISYAVFCLKKKNKKKKRTDR